LRQHHTECDGYFLQIQKIIASQSDSDGRGFGRPTQLTHHTPFVPQGVPPNLRGVPPNLRGVPPNLRVFKLPLAILIERCLFESHQPSGCVRSVELFLLILKARFEQLFVPWLQGADIVSGLFENRTCLQGPHTDDTVRVYNRVLWDFFA